MKIFIIVASALLVGLNIFDVFSTLVVLKHGGLEANPIMLWLMNKIGELPAMLSMKFLFIGLLVWAGFKAADKQYQLSNREFIAVISAYTILIGFYSYFMFTRNLPYVTAFL